MSSEKRVFTVERITALISHLIFSHLIFWPVWPHRRSSYSKVTVRLSWTWPLAKENKHLKAAMRKDKKWYKLSSRHWRMYGMTSLVPQWPGRGKNPWKTQVRPYHLCLQSGTLQHVGVHSFITGIWGEICIIRENQNCLEKIHASIKKKDELILSDESNFIWDGSSH